MAAPGGIGAAGSRQRLGGRQRSGGLDVGQGRRAWRDQIDAAGQARLHRCLPPWRKGREGVGRHGYTVLGGWSRNEREDAGCVALGDGGLPEQHRREQPPDPAASAQIRGHQRCPNRWRRVGNSGGSFPGKKGG